MIYNHMFDLAFEIETPIEDPDYVPAIQLVDAALHRLHRLRASIQAGYGDQEAFGHCDTYTIDDSKQPATPPEASTATG